MSRRLISILALGMLALSVPALLFAQAAKKSAPLPFKIVAKKSANVDLNKKTMTCEGDVRVVSPKTPPYQLDVTCQRLVANGISDAKTTAITATKNVVLTVLSEQGTAANKTQYSIKCTCEKMVYEIVDSEKKLRMESANDATGKAVRPQVTITNLTDTTEPPVVVDGNVIEYNLNTKQLEIHDDVTIENTGDAQ